MCKIVIVRETSSSTQNNEYIYKIEEGEKWIMMMIWIWMQLVSIFGFFFLYIRWLVRNEN